MRKDVRGALVTLLVALAACGGDGSAPEGPGGRTPDLSDAFAYRPDSPWADSIVTCADPRRAPTSCTVGRLPPLSQAGSAVEIGAVLERVVVSHEWMGLRFEEILRRAPADLLELLGATTAIVIDDDVRPSFYWSLTGAIYIDPRHLWLTAGEEATIVDRADYRSGFGSGLSFFPYSTYLRDGRRPTFGAVDGERTLDGRVLAVSALLFHESAHANDFLPPDAVASLNTGETFLEATERLEDRRLSRRLIARWPLASPVWSSLAGVLYRGETPTVAERTLDARAAGLAFEPDGASDPYGYSAPLEDFAMLFEETMLRFHFGLDRRVGFARARVEESSDCRDYEIGWAVDRRLAAPPVAPRAALVAELLLGDPLDDFFDGLGEPVFLSPGRDLCADADLDRVSRVPWS